MTARVCFAAVVLVGVGLAQPVAQAAVLPDLPTVSTIAGSGALGFADGPALAASFVAPTGIAYAPDGTLYIADRDAQRVRKLTPSGNVITIAGSGNLVPLGIGVPGGYRDGAASQALFNMPSAVLPLADGSVLVADTKNYCLRSIKSGAVTTYGGNHLEAGHRDGPAVFALFNQPRSLAQGADGTIYVADPHNGVRKIDANGNVTTMQFADSASVIAVATVRSSPNVLFVATVQSVERVDTASATVTLRFPLDSNYASPPLPMIEDLKVAGPVAALAAFDPYQFVWTDPLKSAVRFGQINIVKDGQNYTRALSAVPSEDAGLGGGDYRDGVGASARVDEPLGIAVAPNGTIAVADTGNRRIRQIGRFNQDTDVLTGDRAAELPSVPNPHEYRIAFVGNSYVWYGQPWNTSIPGMLEQRLRERWPSGARPPRIIPVMRLGIKAADEMSLVDGLLSSGIVDMVIVDLSSYGQLPGATVAAQSFPPGWDDDLTRALARTDASLHAKRIPFLVVEQPGAGDFPDEMAYERISRGPDLDATIAVQRDPNEIEYYQDLLGNAVFHAHVESLNLWPDFMRDYAAARRVPLFGAWDHHLTLEGRRIVAEGIARRVLTMRPWNERSTP